MPSHNSATDDARNTTPHMPHATETQGMTQ